MEGFIGGLVLVLVAAFLLAISHDLGRVSVLDDCSDYGKSKINSIMIDCHRSADAANK